MSYTAADIAAQIQGEVLGDAATLLTGFAPASNARAGDLTFAENPDYLAKAEESAASAILVGPDVSGSAKVLIRVKNPRVAFARVLPLFFPEPIFAPGIHATAVIAASAKIDSTAHVGPYCVISDKVIIGPRAVLQGANHVGDQTVIGEDTRLFPNVTIYPQTVIGNRVRIHAGTVLGSDGFGYVYDQGGHRKVPQVGQVIVHDDVEIGANVTVDRGALGPTIIGKGSKIDNLVQVGHNVVIGEHCIVVSQTGIAGSTQLGKLVTLAGQVGVAGHLKIGDKAIVSAQSGVMHDIPEGEKWLGAPAQRDREAKRQMLALQRLPELLRRVAELERQLGEGPKP